MSLKIKDIKALLESLVICFLVIFLSCTRPENKTSDTAKLYTNPSELKPVDVNDSLYGDFRSDFKAVITPDGWKINYYIKDDSTKYKDIYLKWEKENNVRALNFPSVLIMRSYFLPVYKTETKTHIFFEHGCATDCSTITVLPKNPEFDPYVFDHVIDYDLERGRIVFSPKRSFSLDLLELDIFDLNLNKLKTARFKNHCPLSREHGCIEKVIFTQKTVELLGSFKDEHGKIITEKQTVIF